MSYSSVVMNDGPTVYYRLGEPSGTTANDTTANAYNGTYHGGFTLAQAGALKGDPNKSVLLNGSTGYITSPAGFVTNGWSALTVECWLNLSNNAFAGYLHLIGNDDSPSTSHIGFVITVAPSTDGGSGYFYVGNGTTSGVALCGSGVYSTATWYHIVCTYDGTTLRTYLNGVSTGNTGTVSGTIGTATHNNSMGGSVAGSFGFIPGDLDEIAVYNKVLTASQIKNHYNAAKSVGGTFAFPRRKFGSVL